MSGLPRSPRPRPTIEAGSLIVSAHRDDRPKDLDGSGLPSSAVSSSGSTQASSGSAESSSRTSSKNTLSMPGSRSHSKQVPVLTSPREISPRASSLSLRRAGSCSFKAYRKERLRTIQSQLMSQLETAENGENPPDTKDESDRKTESLGSRAARFASKYQMTASDVKGVLRALEDSGLNPEDVNMHTFKDFLCRVFEIQIIPEELLDELYERTCKDTEFRGAAKCFAIEDFLSWFMCSFSTVARLKSDQVQLAKNLQVLNICRKHGIQSVDLDKIQRVFQKYDADSSGQLNQSEFEAMVMSFLGATAQDISKDRLETWWREIDQDNSGEVDFEEFVDWYLKYFGSANSLTPTQAFYASFNPSVQRQAMLGELLAELLAELQTPD